MSIASTLGQRAVKRVGNVLVAVLLPGSLAIASSVLGGFATEGSGRLKGEEPNLSPAARARGSQGSTSAFPGVSIIFCVCCNLVRLKRRRRLGYSVMILSLIPVFLFNSYLSNNMDDFFGVCAAHFNFSAFYLLPPFYQFPNEKQKVKLYFHSSFVCKLLTCRLRVVNCCWGLFLKSSYQTPKILMSLQARFKQGVQINLTKIMVFY